MNAPLVGFEAAAETFHAVDAENHPGKGGFPAPSNSSSRNHQHPQDQYHYPSAAHPSSGSNGPYKLNDGYAKGNHFKNDFVRGSFNMNQCIHFMKVEWTKVLNMIERDSNAVVWYETEGGEASASSFM